MQVISVENARAVQIFVGDEIKPRSGIYVPDLVRLIGERYGFAASPDVAEIKGGAKFKDGRLITGNKKTNVFELGIFSDGISVTAPTTDDADFISDDAINWLKQHFSFREPMTFIPRQYESNVVVAFDRSIDGTIQAFANIKSGLQAALRELYGVEVTLDINRLAFAADVPQRPDLLNTHFSIERRLGRPYSENRFFSSAPLKNQAHVELLELLEGEMLAS